MDRTAPAPVIAAWGVNRGDGLCEPLLILLLALVSPATAWSQSPSEYQVKAAFLYNFTKFVEWPATSQPTHDAFLIGILGEDPFRNLLDEAMGDKTVNGRPIRVVRLQRVEETQRCQIVFISHSERKRLRLVLNGVPGTGVLTVGDMDGFAQSGGMVNLVLRDNQVHFEVNVAAATKAQLRISSRLVVLAKIVSYP